ncbi:hypothetical protein [Pontibacter actiniarum]|uniref:Secreted protein n=1 Tax=Pontibacter actiniarum TaxID=323450 RepID=A0A1X9YUV0_9BACT|nr:hypothetical protein [Pontibacter actiniarum]ARS36638.1 hypothetical protein CA264_15105 [Pontibacter actiniarum]
MKKLIFMLFTMATFSFATSCDSPAEERADVVEEAEDVVDERAEGDLNDVAEERGELREEMQEYNEAVAEEVDTTVVE